MEPITTLNVGDLRANDRAALEHILGGPLSTDQAVFIMAVAPGIAPNEAMRSEARGRLEETFNKAARQAVSSGVTAEEADAAVEEAMQYIRPRRA
ncbi:MAG: hypothetical protein K8T91_04000 [Planctomycetes bacterium]|nr:hypothetical protein [Planctomycetota bacterium]